MEATPVLTTLFTPLFAMMLAGAAGRSTLHGLERWQTTYLPVFAFWAAAVALVLPPLFSFS